MAAGHWAASPGVLARWAVYIRGPALRKPVTLREHLHYADLAFQAFPGKRAAWRSYRSLKRLHVLAKKKDQPVGVEVAVDFDGLDLRGYGYPQLFYLYQEIFLKRDYAMELGTKTPTIVDCGSNIGTSIAFFKRMYPKARVIGFEPHPKLFPVLRGNMDRNGMADVELHNCALGKENGTTSFFVNANPGYLRSSIRSDRGGEIQITCKLERLSDHLRALDVVDLVKIDVEGAEHFIVDDLVTSGLIAKPRHYVLEYHLNIGEDRSDLSKMLRVFEENGYDYTLKAERKPNGRFQDVLIYCSKRSA